MLLGIEVAVGCACALGNPGRPTYRCNRLHTAAAWLAHIIIPYICIRAGAAVTATGNLCCPHLACPQAAHRCPRRAVRPLDCMPSSGLCSVGLNGYYTFWHGAPGAAVRGWIVSGTLRYDVSVLPLAPHALAAPAVASLVSWAAQYGWTPLHVACSKGHVRVVRRLLSAGADKDTASLKVRAADCGRLTGVILGSW